MKKYVLFILLPLLLACSKDEDTPALDIKTFDFASTKWAVYASDTGSGEFKEVYKPDEYKQYQFIDSLNGRYTQGFSSQTSGYTDFIYYHYADTLFMDFGRYLYYYKIEKLTTKELLLNNFSTYSYPAENYINTPVNRIRLRKTE